MLLKDFGDVIERAKIAQDRLDYIIYQLPFNMRAQFLYKELGYLLKQEAVTDNVTKLISFIKDNEQEITELDDLAR